MGFNYDPELTDDISRVRFALGDTDADKPLLTDEEITYVTSDNGSILEAAAELADALAARYSRRVSVSIDGASFNYQQLSQNYAALATRLRARASLEDGGLGRPVVTGVRIDEMATVDRDSGRVPSQFKIGQFDNTPHEGGGDIGTGGVSTSTQSSDLV